MNELNELEKKVKKIIHNDKGQVELIIKDISKLFLEEIKEAYRDGRHAEFVGYPNSVDDYVKSKYKI